MTRRTASMATRTPKVAVIILETGGTTVKKRTMSLSDCTTSLFTRHRRYRLRRAPLLRRCTGRLRVAEIGLQRVVADVELAARTSLVAAAAGQHETGVAARPRAQRM